MSILDIKDVEAYDNDVVKFLRFFEFPGKSINFEGSSRYKQLKQYVMFLLVHLRIAHHGFSFPNFIKVLEHFIYFSAKELPLIFHSPPVSLH
jgi:hypothetical protein